jgi:hypothetical protein
MPRLTTVLSIAIVAGIAAIFLLPPPWLEPIAAVAAVCALVLVIIVRVNTTKTEPPDNAVAGVLLSIINLPEQPLAKVTEGRALTAFLGSAAFLVSLALSVMVRANV